MKKQLLILVLICITACKKKTQLTYLDKEQISYKAISNHFSCLKSIQSSSLLNETINDFISIINIQSNDKINRLFLIFLMEQGEIINTYKVAVLYSKNNKIFSKKNRGELLIKETKDFEIDKIFKYITSINPEKEITNNELLVIDIQPNETKCYYTKNVKEQIVAEIKKN